MQASSRLLTSSNTGPLGTLGLGPRRSISPHLAKRLANLNCQPTLETYSSVALRKSSPLPLVGSLPNALLTPLVHRRWSRPRSSSRCRATRHGYESTRSASGLRLTGRLPSLSCRSSPAGHQSSTAYRSTTRKLRTTQHRFTCYCITC